MSLIIVGSFIFCLDDDDPSVFRKTFDFIMKNRLAAAQFHILTPLPGTRLYEAMDRDQRITDRDWANYHTSTVVFQPKKMVVPKAKVLREGREKEINSEELVPGDIVLLTSGAKVPADLRLMHTIELKIEEAMLTGESVPSEKIASALKEDRLIPGDQRNMAFMGTVVVNGRAKGVVVETGGTKATDARPAHGAFMQ